ncbi:GAF and ANTAR domain-containing protein [Aeromicrobium halocynthiae]|uniref:GAF and ANTAR domain-containing protein n=1 Tax=Aeromicrobium halocynthiae TaxID=560557 RepID=A0ABP5HJ37_9ACTN
MRDPQSVTPERLAEQLAAAATVEDSVRELVVFLGEALGSEHVSLTRTARSRLRPVARTSELVGRADELQVTTGEGPGFDLTPGNVAPMVVDLGGDPRWPEWGPAVAALGLTGVLWVPLQAGGRRIGTLTVYAVGPEGFGTDELDAAQRLAPQAAATLRAAREVEGLTLALDSRTLVGQAQGILMERFGVDDAQAFAFLRRYSQDHNVKLTEVARGIVDSSVLPDGRRLVGGADEPPGD